MNPDITPFIDTGALPVTLTSGTSSLPTRVRSHGKSHIGLRPRNEDSFDLDTHRRFFVVADGMGGETRGDLASRIAVDTIRKNLVEQAGRPWAFPARLEQAICQAHDDIYDACLHDPELIGMGTTVVGFLVEENGRGMVAHIGDSRAYRMRDGDLRRLTRDHTVAAELERNGLLRAKGKRKPFQNVLTRALSFHQAPKVDTLEISVHHGDTFLLCSDGLSNVLTHRQIRSTLLIAQTPKAACESLVNQALRLGGRDNITVVVVEIF